HEFRPTGKLKRLTFANKVSITTALLFVYRFFETVTAIFHLRIPISAHPHEYQNNLKFNWVTEIEKYDYIDKFSLFTKSLPLTDNARASDASTMATVKCKRGPGTLRAFSCGTTTKILYKFAVRVSYTDNA
ncbi:Uncharacterized protein APZ42_008129, partial [Daphnia magna]